MMDRSDEAAPPFGHHPQDLLPPKIVETFPTGNPTADQRTPEQEAAFEHKKKDIMDTMSVAEMQSRYQELAAQIVERIEDNEQKEEDWQAEMKKKKDNHETETKAVKKILSALQEE